MKAIDHLLKLLQQERRQCKEILLALQAQQENLITRSTEKIVEAATEIEEKASALVLTRNRREIAQRNIAVFLGTEASFQAMLPALHPRVRDEVQDILNGINDALLAVKPLAEQGQRLAQASLNVTADLIRHLQTQQSLVKPPKDS